MPLSEHNRTPGRSTGEKAEAMSALITRVEHALGVAASDTVKAAKFVERSVLPVLKKAQADQSTIEAVTSLVRPQAANIERAGFAAWLLIM